jgi:hypothetical protein
VVLGWWMLRLDLGPWTFFASLTLLSFLLTLALCEVAAAVPFLRPCLGMGPAPRPASRKGPVRLTEGQLEAILSDEAR